MVKIRSGMVSNSSSASFLVHLKDIWPSQEKQIVEYEQSSENTDCWQIKRDGHFLKGWTVCDNGDFGEFLASIGVPRSVVIIDGD